MEKKEGSYATMPRHVRGFIRVIVWQLNLLAFLLAPLGFQPEFVIYKADEEDEDDYYSEYEFDKEDEKDPVH